MRSFWRRNAPDEPVPDTETAAPAGEMPPPQPAPEPEAQPTAPVVPRTLFDRSMGVPEPAGTEAAPPVPQPDAGGPAGGWFGRLRAGLSRSSARLNEGINTIFARRRLDAAA